MSEPTINAAYAAKEELENKIAQLLMEFTDTYRLEVDQITIDTVHHLGERLPAGYLVDVQIKL